jgi:hypothetical protein
MDQAVQLRDRHPPAAVGGPRQPPGERRDQPQGQPHLLPGQFSSHCNTSRLSLSLSHTHTKLAITKTLTHSGDDDGTIIIIIDQIANINYFCSEADKFLILF